MKVVATMVVTGSFSRENGLPRSVAAAAAVAVGSERIGSCSRARVVVSRKEDARLAGVVPLMAN
jgi:hypothetical protein